MRSAFKYLLLFSGLLVSLITFANPVPTFKQVIFFGDSLSDNGNLYRHLAHLIPKYPPYFNGRFSNGYVWSDILSYRLFSQYEITSDNFAVGGATAIAHPFQLYLPVTLEMEYDDYIAQNIFHNKDNTLYVIWIGGNDYLQGAKDIEGMTTAVINAIVNVIKELSINKGAQFLVISMPDLALTPEARVNDLADNYQQLALRHNQKLHEAILSLQKQNPDIKIHEFNFLDHPILHDLIESQAYREKIDKEYHVNITNVIDPCWTGSLFNPLSPNAIQQTFNNQTVLSHTLLNPLLGQDILHNPELLEAYRVNQLSLQGVIPCKDPEGYIFWDNIHPTTMVHGILADVFLKEISTAYR